MCVKVGYGTPVEAVMWLVKKSNIKLCVGSTQIFCNTFELSLTGLVLGKQYYISEEPFTKRYIGNFHVLDIVLCPLVVRYALCDNACLVFVGQIAWVLQWYTMCRISIWCTSIEKSICWIHGMKILAKKRLLIL